jgi:trigger factor
MEYVVEEVDELRRKLKITIPETVVTERVRGAYKELNRQMKMPGFRPGKIPQNILEKQVPAESFARLFQELMQEYYDKVLLETGIVPVGEPEIDHTNLKDFKKDSALAFSVILSIRPKVDLKPYKGLCLKRRESTVTENEVGSAIEKILLPLSKLEAHAADHSAKMGDVVTLDFDGFLYDQPLENGNARDYKVRLGEKKLISGFEEQVVGRKKGDEFEVRVNLPQDWNHKMRRLSVPIPGEAEDKEVDVALFKTKLKELHKVVLPEVTDELVRRKEIGMDSVEKFRRAVKTELQAHKDHQEELRIKEELFTLLVKENDVKPPESWVSRELKFMVEGVKYQIGKSGMKVEDSGFDEGIAKREWRGKAEFNGKGYMILEEIADRENIRLAESDLEEEYKRLAQETGQEVEAVRIRMNANRESLNHTASSLRGQKALNYVFSHCEFEYEKPKTAN